jgi:WhiB family redox-sensing transcriptional regulator
MSDWHDRWMDDAACKDIGPELFFAEPPGDNAVLNRARAVCNGDKDHPPCPVRLTCLEYALDNDLRWGVWGGLGQFQRAQLRRQRRRKSA